MTIKNKLLNLIKKAFGQIALKLSVFNISTFFRRSKCVGTGDIGHRCCLHISLSIELQRDNLKLEIQFISSQ